MSCAEIDKKIRAVFTKLQGEAQGKNITDEMVVKSDFNDLNTQAEQQCGFRYSIDWTENGYVLGCGKA
ncbi:MAG: hypothetical protein EOP36_11770 [Rubrivivax sp.]|nr:MAG: hypothetical protein EOP36_11770 [Rubrivivax sp.]